MDQKLINTIDIEKIWKKTLMSRIFKKKKPSVGWINQLVRLKNIQYKNKYNIDKAYKYEDGKIIYNFDL